MRRLAGALLAGALLAVAAPSAHAAPPSLVSTWVGEVTSSSARLHAEVNPNGAATSYHFDYITAAAYEANLAAAKEGFAGAAKVPTGFDPTVGAGSGVVSVSQPLTALKPETAYRYRAVTKNSFGTTSSATLSLTTQGLGGGPLLLDGRGWEMVSPVQKNGGQVDAPGTIFGGGTDQAAASSSAIAYSSATSFDAAARGAPQGSQYIATRTASGWASQNITTPLLSGSYGIGAVGVPYQLFASDLSRALLLNGRPCRDGGSDCPVANPPLPGTTAPPGYQNYYRRQADGSFTALVNAADLSHSSLDASHFGLTPAGATADLSHVVLASCAALTAAAVEVPLGEGCDPAAANLYEWSTAGLSLVNLAPGAALAAPAGAISEDGGRVYFRQGGNLYLRAGGGTAQVDEDEGGGGEFEAAGADGAVAFFSKEGHLYRYSAPTDASTDLTPAGGLKGVLGASVAGDYVYFQDTVGLWLRHGDEAELIAPGGEAATAGSYPPATGTARVSADGTRLAFLSTASLTGFDNVDQKTGKADAELYLYEADAGHLACISCNPTGARPLGPASIPGVRANGSAPGSLAAYKPRVLTAGGRRVFFDSADALVLGDTNAEVDVYEWEAQGTGSCTKPGGCLALLSSGKGEGPVSFVDASADGSDAYFLTERSLVGTDPGAIDLYDARVGGGFPEPSKPIPCEGDACQSLPSEPPDPAVTSLIPGPGNPAVRYPHRGRRHHKKTQQQKHKKRQRGHRVGTSR